MTTQTAVQTRTAPAIAYVDPNIVTREREQTEHPERFPKSIPGYKFGEWLGTPAPRPEGAPVRHLAPASRDMGYWELTLERQTRREGWLDEDEGQEDVPEESTADDFNDVPFRRVSPQASRRRVPQTQVAVYKATKQRAPRTRSYSITVPEGTDLSRKPIPWAKTDWQPLWGIDLRTGEEYPIMSQGDPSRPLTRYLEGLENRRFASWNFEDPDDELLQVDLTMHRGWDGRKPYGRIVSLTAGSGGTDEHYAQQDEQRLRRELAQEREYERLVEEAKRDGLLPPDAVAIW